MIKLLTPNPWKDYELIDTGLFEKLERYGTHTIIRPEPQACWNKSIDREEWLRMADVVFTGKSRSDENGEWTFRRPVKEQWFISYDLPPTKIKFRLGFTSFKHVGIFPEQACNWDYIYKDIKNMPIQNPSVLNLFAYTGGASLAAKAAGADVVHVDSVKPVVNWANDNMIASNLTDIRWVIEDAMKFVRREVKRGKKYNGIILDPPSYGKGPAGEKWILEDGINELIAHCSQLLDPENYFFIMNLYSIGFSSLICENLIDHYFEQIKNKEAGELYISDRAGRKLPLGVFIRFSNGKM